MISTLHRFKGDASSDSPVASVAPALATDEATSAIPVGRVGAPLAVDALDVAASLGPVLEVVVVAALTGVQRGLGQRLGADHRTRKHARCHKARCNERELHHLDEVTWMDEQTWTRRARNHEPG